MLSWLAHKDGVSVFLTDGAGPTAAGATPLVTSMRTIFVSMQLNDVSLSARFTTQAQNTTLKHL